MIYYFSLHWHKLLLFSHPVMSDSSRPHGLQHARRSCPSLSPRACSNSGPLSRRCHPTISSSIIPFSSCPQFFPYTGCCCQVTSVVSDSVRPHRWQPTRLHHPWDSPGENTGVGCHFILQCMKVKVTQSCLTLCDPMDYTVHGILQARVLEWVAYPFSSGSSRPRN